MVRYIAKFEDGRNFLLYDEEYYNDKAVFWRSHVSNAFGFMVEVCKKGIPIEVLDKKADKLIKFESRQDFTEWFEKNQALKPDFGFSELSNEEAIIKEAKKRVNELMEYFQLEIQELKEKNFNPWRIDGGYKQIELASNLGFYSIENIQNKNIIDATESFINIYKECFLIPTKMKVDDETVIAYSKKGHEELNPIKLIRFCEANLQAIEQKVSEADT